MHVHTSANDPRVIRAFELLAEVAAERRGTTNQGPADVLEGWGVNRDYGVYEVAITCTYKSPIRTTES
jgi:hypothetical protein